MPRGGHRIGAGRPGKHARVEDCRTIDIRQWARAGMLVEPWEGAWQWQDPVTLEAAAVIRVSTEPDAVFLSYFANKVPVSEWVFLDLTHCNFGGSRPWFLCPGCDRRVAALHIKDLHFRCRSCHGLTYRTQCEDAIGRAWIAQSKLERQLLKNYRRPKGMHKSTRSRLLREITKLEMRREDLVEAGFERLLKAGF